MFKIRSENTSEVVGLRNGSSASVTFVVSEKPIPENKNNETDFHEI